MGEQPLYDLAPLLEIMGVGAVIALAPLLWVWRRNRGAGPARYLQALGLLTLFLTFDLVLFGAFTRLTDSVWAARTGRAATATPALSGQPMKLPWRKPPCRAAR